MAAIAGVQTATWNRFAFAKWVVRARDNFGPSFYAHRIPHRTGAKQEQTGNVPFRVTYDLQFAGRSWADDAKTAFNNLISTPRGDLVHHLRGKVRAVVMPIEASWEPTDKGNHLTASVTFEEDTLTNNVAFTRSPGTLADDISTSTTAADSNAAAFVSDVFGKFRVGIPALRLRAQALAAQVATSTFTGSTRDFAGAAVSQFEAGQLQPTLAASLGRLPAQLDLMIVAHRLAPPVSPYSQVSIDYSEAALAQARELDRAIRANLPPPIYWQVRQLTTLLVFVGRLYPTRSRDDKFELARQIALINGLTRPDAIAAGRRLIVPAP